jgi:hypothetical protein
MEKLNMRKLKLEINISVEGCSSPGINLDLYISLQALKRSFKQ